HGLLPLFGGPLCVKCGVRSGAPHPVAGYYAHCPPLPEERESQSAHGFGDGGHQRTMRMDGTRRSRGSRTSGGRGFWSRYLRVVRTVADHGMVLLCFNCHMHEEKRKRDTAA